MKGFDIAEPVDDRHVAELRAAGIGFVAGYYSYNEGKNLTAAECRALSAAGIAIVAVFEARGDRYDNFTAAQANRDAAQALRLAAAVGQPPGSAIYFAVDFDASDDQIAGGVAAYAATFASDIRGAGYRPGVYGSGAVLAAMSARGLAEFFWMADAGGWNGSRGYRGKVHIHQGLPTHVLGLSVDPDTAEGDFGQWTVGTVKPMPVPVPAPEPSPVDIADVQLRLNAWGLDRDLAVDGRLGPLTREAIEVFQEAQGLPVTGIPDPATRAALAAFTRR